MTNLTKENLIKKYDVPAGYRYLVVARKNDDLLYLTNDLQDIVNWYFRYLEGFSEKQMKDFMAVDVETGRQFSIASRH
jgi:hypothetical protein